MGNCQGQDTSIDIPPKHEYITKTPWQKYLETRLKELNEHIKANPNFQADLLYSLQTANSNASQNGGLDSRLYEAFRIAGVNGWPTSFEEYFAFLTWFASYIPQQSDYNGWISDTQDYSSTHQEVYDRLCHFSYLINQPLSTSPVGEDKKTKTTVQDDEWFADWLIKYAQVWGKFCDSPESISPETINSFYKNSKKFKIADSMIPMNEEDIPGSINKYTIYNEDGKPMKPNCPSGWMSWNQMFARELNPGLRPIASSMDNSVVCSPADCTFKATYPIDDTNEVLQIPSNDRIKGTHAIGNVADLLKDSKYAKAFARGTYVHYFLGPYSYHRFHTPVTGVVKECFPIPGRAYLDVGIDNNGQFEAADDATNGYEFVQARGLITIDTAHSPHGNVGIVAVIPVGMCQIASVSMIATEGSELQKGDEFGYFQFGGSDIIMLFQEGVVSNLSTDSNRYNLYGQKVTNAVIQN